MSSNLIKLNKQTTPGIIINNYPREFDLLNCVALKARYDLREIDKFHKDIMKENMEKREQELSTNLAIQNMDEDDGWENNNVLFELKMLTKSRNRNIGEYNKYLTPIEERQKRFFDYYKQLFLDMQNKGGINYYTNKIIPNFIKIQKAQKSIQNKITKSKSVIINYNSKDNNSLKKLPFLKLSSNNENNGSDLLDESKRKSSLKLSSFKENNIFNQKKLPLLKLFSFNESEDNNSFRYKNDDKSIINDNNNKNNENLSQINDNISKNSDNNNNNKICDNINNNKNIKENLKKRKIKIRKIKNLNRSCDYAKREFIFDKNFNPIVDSASFKILSKRGNIQFFNSIWRTKNINDYINSYNAKEVNSVLNQIKQQRKKFYK